MGLHTHPVNEDGHEEAKDRESDGIDRSILKDIKPFAAAFFGKATADYGPEKGSD
ncbi:hypothetical protein ACS3QZ_03205 [Shimia sp. W99]